MKRKPLSTWAIGFLSIIICGNKGAGRFLARSRASRAVLGTAQEEKVMALLLMDWFIQLLIVLDTLGDAAMTQTKLLLCLRDTFTSQGNELISPLIRFHCSTHNQWVLAGMGVVEGLAQRREQRGTCSAKGYFIKGKKKKRKRSINCIVSWSCIIADSSHLRLDSFSSAWSKLISGSSGTQQETKVIYSPTSARLQPSCSHCRALPACTSHPQEIWDRLSWSTSSSSQWPHGWGSSSRVDEETGVESPGEYHHHFIFILNIMINYSTWENFVSGKYDIRVQLGE